MSTYDLPLPQVKKAKFTVKGGPDVYEMKSKPRGLCLIINNVKFDHLNERLGSDHDARRLESVFKDLHFKVTVKRDLTSQGMLNELRNLAEGSHVNYDAAVVVVLTHGSKDLLCGTEYNPYDEGKIKLTYEDLVEPLNNVNCFNLRHKPKMFFVQACMGPKAPLGIEDCASLFRVRPTRRLPETSDVLLSFSSQEGYASARNENLGSPYAAHLAYALAQHAHHKDIVDILSIVERQVQQTYMILKSIDEELCLSTTVKLLGWSKKVFFNPGDQDAMEIHLPKPFKMSSEDVMDWQYSGAYSKKQEMDVSETKSSGEELWVIGGSADPEVLRGANHDWILKFGTGLDRCQVPVGNSGKVVYLHQEDEIFSWNSKKRKLTLAIKTAVLGSSLAVHNGQIFVVGGDLLGDTVKSFDTTTGNWTDYLDGKNSLHSQDTTFGKPALIFKDKLYVFQGESDQKSGTLKILDLKIKSWTTSKTELKVPRSGQAMVACQQYIWVFGGHDGSRCLSDVVRYCPHNDTWEPKRSMPTPRSKLSVAFFHRKFYATGGQTDEQQMVDVVEIYDPCADQWVQGCSLQVARAGHGSIVI